MAKRVSADTITEITSNPAFRGRQTAESPPPTTEQLTDRIRQELVDRIAAARALVAADAPPSPDPYAPRPEVRLARALEDQKQFEEMLKEVPKGFRLSPVLYSRIDAKAKEELTQEYTYHVRPRFLKFLAENHADELKDLGICERGVERMRQGLDPVNENGLLYSVNIDHIIERNGSGVWGATKEKDPDQPDAVEKFHPNHFGNFIILPEKIHEFKNELNDIQHASDTPHGQNKWVLMMVPERNATFSGFVCPKQDASHRLAGLDLRAMDDFKKTEHGEFIVNTVLHGLAEFKDMGSVRQIVRGQILEADRLRTKVAELAAQPKSGLRKAFNDAVAKEPATQAHLDNLVKPALRDVTNYVKNTFAELSAKTGTSKERAAFWKFARFFRSQPVRDLQTDIEALPFEEASEMHRSFLKLKTEVTKVCDRLDAENKARYQKQDNESVPDFRQDNNPPARTQQPQGEPISGRKPRRGPPQTPRHEEEGREKRTFGRPGHFKRRG
ncbi:MAG: hypothetical protein ACAH83_05180 [Alphaproteobacteria bacterium]